MGSWWGWLLGQLKDQAIGVLVGVGFTIIVGAVGLVVARAIAWRIYGRQARESGELLAVWFGRFITALVVADVISPDREERARQVALGQAQQFQGTPVARMPRLTMTVLDELIRHGSGQSGPKTNPSGKAAYGPEGPGGFTRTG